MSGAVLTQSKIEKAMRDATANRSRCELGDGRVRGLTLRVSQASATWTLTYKPRGSNKKERLRVGLYEDLGIKDARILAEEFRGQIAKGQNPAEEQREKAERLDAERKVIAERMTFGQLCRDYLKSKRQLKWYRHYEGILTRTVLKPVRTGVRRLKLANKAAEDVTAADINKVLDCWRSEGQETQALRTYECFRGMFRWAVKREHLKKHPMNAVEKPNKPKPRERVLNVDEMREFWFGLQDYCNNENTQRILQLGLLLGQRSGEIGGMTRAELSKDGLTWTIPASRTKNGRKHTVPLPPRARQIIDGAIKASPSKRYLFATAARQTRKEANSRGYVPGQLIPVTSDVIANHVGKMQPSLDFKDADGRPAPFVMHDLRRSVASHMEGLGTPRAIVSHLLNHVSETKGDVTGRHYSHADMTRHVRVALTKWQAVLEDILDGGNPYASHAEDALEIERQILKKSKAPMRVIAGGRA